ncbi:MAG: molybdopterin dinucleotide binding domain-containing protein [Promethearchaeota archaeon]|jgi:formylmethanofuran dehydrogenase subunit D
MDLVLNTVRMVDHDQVKEYSCGDDSSLKENLAICILNPEDVKKLNLTPSLNLKLTTKYGEVVVKIKEKKDIPPGTVLMPVSIWANLITGISNGQLVFKNIKVNAETVRDDVLDIKDLLNKLTI